MAKKPLQFVLNGSEKAVFVEDGQNLLDVLRRGVGDLTPKYGCGQGACGTCTLLVEGVPHLSCLTLAETVEGKRVSYTRGLGRGSELQPLERALGEKFGAQSGYCTAGMLMAAKALLDKNPSPTRQEVVGAISVNICRCTGYEAIINAILDA